MSNNNVNFKNILSAMEEKEKKEKEK